MSRTPGSSQANSTALRAIEVLLLFDDDRPVWTVNEIAERFSMPRSTAYRYLASLRETGLLEADESGRYRLGTRILALARVARKGIGILDLAMPHLRQLQAVTGETVLFNRRQGATIVVVECLESQHSVRISFDRGHIQPNPATASAKVLLAHAPEPELAGLVESRAFIRYTDRTETDPAMIRDQLRQVRDRGYAVNDGEVDEGVRAVAAPIFNARGEVFYSVGVVGPMFRLADQRLTEALAAVRSTADLISHSLRENG